MNQADMEANDLSTHVVACAERYKMLFERVARIERILLGFAGTAFTGLGAIVWQLFQLVHAVGAAP